MTLMPDGPPLLALGGSRYKAEAAMITMYTQPRMIKFCTSPYLATKICISGPAIRLAKPKPMIARPVAKPRLLGNHLTSVETGVI